MIRHLIATTLEDVAGFELAEAADGEEAVAVAERDGPALVFLDIDMPRLNGIEACKRLRALPATADATIVMLTASGGRGLAFRVVAAGGGEHHDRRVGGRRERRS